MYFNDLAQKKMRKQQDGLLLQVIYLKLMLLSCNSNGLIMYQGIYDTLSQEIAETINESEQDIEKALAYYEQNNLLQYQEQDVVIPQAQKLVGSETQVAERVRKHRQKTETLQSNADLLQSNTDVTMCNTEKELELEKELDKELELKLDVYDNTTKRPYGQYSNIYLTEQEHQQLYMDFSEKITDNYLNKISCHIRQKGGTGYRNAYQVVRDWILKDYTPEEIEQAKTTEDKFQRLMSSMSC